MEVQLACLLVLRRCVCIDSSFVVHGREVTMVAVWDARGRLLLVEGEVRDFRTVKNYVNRLLGLFDCIRSMSVFL